MSKTLAKERERENETWRGKCATSWQRVGPHFQNCRFQLHPIEASRPLRMRKFLVAQSASRQDESLKWMRWRKLWANFLCSLSGCCDFANICPFSSCFSPPTGHSPRGCPPKAPRQTSPSLTQVTFGAAQLRHQDRTLLSGLGGARARNWQLSNENERVKILPLFSLSSADKNCHLWRQHKLSQMALLVLSAALRA